MEVQVERINGEVYLKPLFAWPVPVAGGEHYPAACLPVPDPTAPPVVRVTVQASQPALAAPLEAADGGSDH